MQAKVSERLAVQQQQRQSRKWAIIQDKIQREHPVTVAAFDGVWRATVVWGGVRAGEVNSSDTATAEDGQLQAWWGISQPWPIIGDKSPLAAPKGTARDARASLACLDAGNGRLSVREPQHTTAPAPPPARHCGEASTRSKSDSCVPAGPPPPIVCIGQGMNINVAT